MATKTIKNAARELRARLDDLLQTVDLDGRADEGTVREARRIRDAALHQGRALTEGGELRASEQREYDALEAIVFAANDLAADAQRQVAGLTRAPVFGARGADADDPELRQAFDRFLRTGEAGELRALGVGTGAAGGFTAPDGFRSKVTETLKAHGGVRSVAEVVTTSDGTALPWPTIDDTANEGTGVQAEGTAVAEQDAAFGQRELNSHMYPSGIVKVSVQLAQDNAVDLETRLARWLGQRIHRKQSGHFVTGTGTGQPQGAVTGGTVGKTGAAGQTTSATYDDLVDLVHSVDPAYRENADECAWLLNDASFAKVRKLKDADGRPLVEPDVKRGAPNSILGFRVVIDQGMPAMAASAKSIAFGNFRAGYVVRDVRAVEVVRFNERYMDALQVGFLAFLRSDGMVDDADAFRLYEHPAA